MHPQRRQRFVGVGGKPGGIGRGLRRQGGGGAGGFQSGAGDRPRGFGPSTLDRQQFGIGLADEVGDVAEPIGLPRLTLEREKLLVQLCAGVLGAGQIGFGGPQFDLGLAAASMQAGDPRGFLQHHTAIFRTGADEGADAALADHGGGAGARGQIGEQGLHVPGAGILAVDAVRRTAPTLQLAADRQFRLIAEWGRGGAERFFQQQRNFRRVAGFAPGCPGENNVVHFGAAQVSGAAFAHGPAQGLHDIGLTAAVGAYDSGQSI